MQNVLNISPVLRAVGIIGAVAVLVTGVTFAALQDTATLTDNTIASATAELNVDNTDDAGSGFGATDVGLEFTGVIPGGGASAAANFQLENNSDTGVDMEISVEATSLPVWDVTVDNTKVTLDMSCTDADETYTVSGTLDALNTAAATFATGDLAAGDIATCTATVTMDADAFTGSGASTTTGFDLEFTGAAV